MRGKSEKKGILYLYKIGPFELFYYTSNDFVTFTPCDALKLYVNNPETSKFS